jgi:hypothetical protein
MPKKTFTAGEVLTAADVNTFLMDQSVMTFADSGARGSAIGTATEGMLTYLNDSDTYQSWNGSAWVGVGGGAATNAIINGAFEINQRNFTSTTTNATYGFDRFVLRTNDALCTYSAQAFSPGESPSTNFEGTNYARLVTAGQTAANTLSVLRQVIENVRTFAGRTVTMSFYAKAASGSPKINISLTQSFGAGGSAFVEKFATPATLTTSWARYSFTLTLDPLTGKTVTTNTTLLASIFVSAGTDFAATGTGIQSNTFDIWGVQLEAGSEATPFRRNANSLQGELAACQRYYYRTTLNSFSKFCSGFNRSTTVMSAINPHPVQMRGAPSFGSSVASSFFAAVGVGGSVGSSIAAGDMTSNNGEILLTTTGLTTNAASELGAQTNPAFIEFSSEL